MFSYDPYLVLSIQRQRGRGMREQAARYALARRARTGGHVEESPWWSRMQRRGGSAAGP